MAREPQSPWKVRARTWPKACCVLAALAGLLGLLPVALAYLASSPAAQQVKPHALTMHLVWLAITAAPLGIALAGEVPRPSLWLGAPVLGWAGGAWAAAQVSRVPPHFVLGLLVAVGLFALGLGLGWWLGRARSVGAAGLGLLLTTFLAILPARGGLGERAPSPAFARLTLEFSPATWVLESAGLDWMRHAFVYGPLQSDRFERAPVDGKLAGTLACVLGCAAMVVGRLRARRTF